MKLPVKAALAAAILLSVAACGGPSGTKTADKPVSLFQWERLHGPAPFLADYEKTYGEKPNITIFADEDEAFAKMRAGYHPDVMGPCYYEFPRWQGSGGCSSRSTPPS